VYIGRRWRERLIEACKALFKKNNKCDAEHIPSEDERELGELCVYALFVAVSKMKAYKKVDGK
jgi:hypothetical protein